MALYQKYRPQTFNDMIGNEAEIESLEKMIQSSNRPHVFLFSGETGCGKTTAARICAQLVGAGELSITEINSSNNRGIDTARQIIEQMQMMPIDGTAQVYIIDEVHKATTDWQNAMLKPTEDTPDHVYFFLCTTDPQKLLPTLKKRCQVITFNPIPEDLLQRLIKRVARKEAIEITPELSELIAKKSEGSARVSLQILEKIVGIDPEKALKVISAYVDEDSAEVIELCRALLSSRAWPEVCKVLKGLKEAAVDAEKARYAVLGYMSSVLLGGKQNDKAALALEYFSEPFYSSGFPGLTLACYQTLFAG